MKARLDPVIIKFPEKAKDVYLDGEGELIKHTPVMDDVGHIMEVPMLEMGGWSGVDDYRLSADIDGNFSFNPSLFL